MGNLGLFNFITLNGFFKGAGGDISWHQHRQGEEHDFSVEGAKSQSTLLFGRITYEMMASYWPSPMAAQNDPVMAEEMNKSEKIVFSKTLARADWQNTTIIKEDMIEAVSNMKKQGKTLTILGSGSISRQLAAAGLIDTYQFMLDPVAIGKGEPIFNGIDRPLHFKLTDSKVFKSGILLLTYAPA